MIDKKRLTLLLSTANTMGLNPKLINDRGLISIEVNGMERYLFYKASNPNDQMASWLAKNKYVSRLIFERNGLPNIPFCVSSSISEAKNFLSKHGRIVAKPIKGQKSQDILLISTEDELEKVDLEECILEQFIKGQETRFLVVDGEVKAAHYKVYEGDINNPETVQRVSLKKVDWDKDLVKLSIKAAAAIGLNFAAVDFIVSGSDRALILEINSAPGLERFQEPDQGPPIDAMGLYLEQMVKNYSQ
jgi:tetrahydromethanopterin:alpha-L-glutamate ligase